MYSFSDFLGNVIVADSLSRPLYNNQLFADEPFIQYMNWYDNNSDGDTDDAYYWECSRLNDEAFLKMHNFVISHSGSFLFIPSGDFNISFRTEQSFYSLCSQFLFSDASSALAFAVENKSFFLEFNFFLFTTSRYPLGSWWDYAMPVSCASVSFAPECCNLDYSPIVRLLGEIPA